MTLLASTLISLQEAGWGSSLRDRVRSVVCKLLLPKRYGGDVFEKYFRKALRVGVWKRLKSECRALLLALRKWGGEVRSSVLKSILERLFLEIEISTTKGRALYYGVIIAFQNGMREILDKTSTLLALGIFYLNNPPMYRIYG